MVFVLLCPSSSSFAPVLMVSFCCVHLDKNKNRRTHFQFGAVAVVVIAAVVAVVECSLESDADESSVILRVFEFTPSKTEKRNRSICSVHCSCIGWLRLSCCPPPPPPPPPSPALNFIHILNIHTPRRREEKIKTKKQVLYVFLC